jgi:hypothetical protein
MTARCRSFVPGGSVAAGHYGEPEIRDTRITPSVHKNILLSPRKYQTERRDVE